MKVTARECEKLHAVAALVIHMAGSIDGLILKLRQFMAQTAQGRKFDRKEKP